MKLEKFKAGTWRQRYQYKSFEPVPVNTEWTWEDPTINSLLEKATQALGELNAFSLIVPDIDLFIEMHVVKEAQSIKDVVQFNALSGAAPYIGAGVLGAAVMTPENAEAAAIDQAYNDYLRDELEANTAADTFTRMRSRKAGYWEQRRQELLDMVDGLGELANDVVLPALDKPLQGYLGLTGDVPTQIQVIRRTIFVASRK